MTSIVTFDLDLNTEQGHIFGSNVDHNDDLLSQQGQGQRSRFRTLLSKIVKTLHVPTKCFHFFISFWAIYTLLCYKEQETIYKGKSYNAGKTDEDTMCWP